MPKPPYGSPGNPVKTFRLPAGTRFRTVGGYRDDGTKYMLPEKDQTIFVTPGRPSLLRVLKRKLRRIWRIVARRIPAPSQTFHP